MSAAHPSRQASNTRECCVHEAIHSRKMEGIHTGAASRARVGTTATAGTGSTRRAEQHPAR